MTPIPLQTLRVLSLSYKVIDENDENQGNETKEEKNSEESISLSKRQKKMKLRHYVDSGEDKIHDVIKLLRELLLKDNHLEEIEIIGEISIADVITLYILIGSILGKNNTLRKIKLITEDKYKNQKEIDETVQRKFHEMIEKLHQAICGKKSKSVFYQFQYPLLDNVFLLDDRITHQRSEIEGKLDSHK